MSWESLREFPRPYFLGGVAGVRGPLRFLRFPWSCFVLCIKKQIQQQKKIPPSYGSDFHHTNRHSSASASTLLDFFVHGPWIFLIHKNLIENKVMSQKTTGVSGFLYNHFWKKLLCIPHHFWKNPLAISVNNYFWSNSLWCFGFMATIPDRAASIVKPARNVVIDGLKVKRWCCHPF